jgi:hypothetical protein
MTSTESWTPQQRQRQLELIQLATGVIVGDLHVKLEFCLRAGNGPWGKAYECLGTLDQLEATIRGTDLRRKWKMDPVDLVCKLIRQIQAFQMPVLDPYLVELRLLSNDLETLLKHSARAPSPELRNGT